MKRLCTSFRIVKIDNFDTLAQFFVDMLDLLLDIPRLLALTILNEFGDWRYFIVLDNAYCNTLRRNAFLELLSCTENVFTELPKVPRANYKCFIEWVVDRQVRISHMVVISALRQVPAEVRNQLFFNTGAFLESISFEWTIGSIKEMLELTWQHCPRLKHLAIWFCSLNGPLKNILRNCRQLKAIRFHECHTIRSSQFLKLSLTHMRSVVTHDNVEESAVRAICEACPHLTRLQFAYNKLLSDAAAVHIRNNCKQLIALNLSHCRALTDQSLVTIFHSCTQIRELDVSGCDKLTDITIRALTMYCASVSKLLIQNNPNYTTKSMHLISRSFATSLRVLYVSGCALISSLGLKLVLLTCCELTSLDIGINELSSDPAVLLMLPRQCKHLVELVLSELRLSDNILQAVAMNCHALELFHIYEATGFSVHAVHIVIISCTYLKELLVSVDDTSVITTAAVQAMRVVNPVLNILTENYILGHGVLDGPDD